MSLAVTIPSTKTENAGGKPYTLYLVEVSTPTGVVTVERRYTDFSELAARLKKEHPKLTTKEAFPGKNFIPFTNLSPSFVLDRREKLEAWIRDIMRHQQIATGPHMTKFLELQPDDIVGMSPTEQLFAAARDGELAAVQSLTKDPNVDINEPAANGYRPLDRAASRGYTKVVKALIAAGAEVNATDDAGDTALHLSAQEGYQAIVELLVEAGAAVDAADMDNDTPLILASSNGHLPIVNYLISLGADVNAQGENGNTALQWAASYGHLPVIEALHKAGASLKEPNAQRNPPICSATLAKQGEVVEYLIKAGVDVNQPGEDGDTALHLAAGNGLLPTVELLLASNADPNIRNTDELTPLTLATRYGYEDVASALRKHGAKNA